MVLPASKIRLLLLLLPALSCLANAQSNAAELLSRADRLFWLDNWVEARPLFAEVEQQFAAQGDRRNALYARISRLRSDAETTSYTQVSADLARELENPLVQEDPKLKLRCLVVKGTADLSIDPISSERVWNEALEVARQSGEKGWEERASGELAVIAFLNGNATKAQQLVSSALFSAMMLGDTAGQIRDLSLIGVGLLELGRNDDALGYLDRAITLAKKNPDTRFPFMAYMGKAQVLEKKGQLSQADELLQEALAYVNQFNMKVYKADLLLALGNRSLHAKDPGSALKAFEDAATAAKQVGMPRPYSVALFQLALLHKEQGNLTQAQAEITESMNASRQLVDRYVLPGHLAVAADISAELGQIQQADALYEEATDTVEAMLVNVPSPTAKTSLIAAMSDIYIGHFVLAVQQLHDIPKAFEIVERARGRVAADIIRIGPSERTEIPIATEQEKELTHIQIELLRTNSIAARKQLLDQLNEAEARLAPVVLGRSRNEIAFRGRPATLEEVQRSLRPEELILEFVLSEPHSWCLAISQNAVQDYILSSGKSIDNVADQYLKSVKSAEPEANAEQLSKQLFALLLGPVREYKAHTHIVIVADGKLHFLPFDGLLDSAGNYVVDSHLVTLNPSATVFQLLRTTDRQRQSPRALLGFATSRPGSVVQTKRARGMYDLRGAKFPELPRTGEELSSISKIAGKSARVFYGSRATEAAFKSQPLNEFLVVHLALHAFADPHFPERSAVVFNPDTSSKEDGLLQAREIKNLRLNAELVTLSACDTGIGKIEGQEGVDDLVSAFLFSGAQTVIASLWPVDDIATAALMQGFYSHLAAGEGRGSALRNAKLDFRKRYGTRALPYYWAGFSMIGEGARPITFGR